MKNNHPNYLMRLINKVITFYYFSNNGYFNYIFIIFLLMSDISISNQQESQHTLTGSASFLAALVSPLGIHILKKTPQENIAPQKQNRSIYDHFHDKIKKRYVNREVNYSQLNSTQKTNISPLKKISRKLEENRLSASHRKKDNPQKMTTSPTILWRNVLNDWKSGNVSTSLIADLRRHNCYFETTPLTRKHNTAFEYRLIPAHLTDTPDASAFGKKTKGMLGDIATFKNLSGDSRLVSPADNSENFANIHQFIKNAPDAQIKKFFAKVAEAAIKGANEHGKVWVSTHGAGVPWLHGRIDSFPKYYQTEEYRDL